jgi:hypothetical protein
MPKRLTKIQTLERKLIRLSIDNNEDPDTYGLTKNLVKEHVNQEKKKKKAATLWLRINISDAELEALHITKDDITDAPS